MEYTMIFVVYVLGNDFNTQPKQILPLQILVKYVYNFGSFKDQIQKI